MNRYVALAKPLRADDDDWYPDGHRSTSVLVTDDRPVNTGLFTATGIPIWRVIERGPIGFRGRNA